MSLWFLLSLQLAWADNSTRNLRGGCVPSYHVNCMHNPNCCDPTTTCYAKDHAVAVCLHSCKPGIHSNDLPQYQTPWSCDVVGSGSRPSPPPSPKPSPVPRPSTAGKCVANYKYNCMHNPNCCDPTTTCYAKNDAVAVCLHSCRPGIHSNDPPQWRTPWTCDLVGSKPSPPPLPPPATPPVPSAPAQCVANYKFNCMDNPNCCDPTAKCYVKDNAVALCLQSCEPSIHKEDPPQYQTPWSCRLLAPAASVPTPSPASGPKVPSLLKPSDGELLEFYMYRAQNDADYPLENVNAGNLEGIMWYLQNEVLSGVYGAGPKFGITRILRIKVQVRATQPLVDKGMNFGIRVAFDSGKCTGPDCSMDWQDYGYNVGCNKLGSWPFPTYDTHFEGSIWYSLPGSCPSESYLEKSADKACVKSEPGGKCSGTPSGTFNCTWNYENAGELHLTELYRDIFSDQKAFWAGNSDAENSVKVQVARNIFAAKYGPDPPAPACDFDRAKIYG